MYIFLFGVIPLPVTPGELNISTPSMNETITLINHGEINIPRSPGLREISFEFMLPRQKYHFSNYSIGDYTASTLIPLLNLWKETKLPFQFIVTRLSPSNQIFDFTNIKVLIEDFTYKENAKEYGMDVMCNIKLKEYKDYPSQSGILQTIVEVAEGVAATAIVASVASNRGTTSKTIPKTYIVKEGDTLWSICKKELGDGQKYKEIAELNNISNPDLIYPGQELRLS